MLEKYYPTSHCPICGNELFRMHFDNSKINWQALCNKNKCFAIDFGIEKIRLRFFDRQGIFKDREKAIKYHDEKVKYWKENDRYLAELLTRS